MPVDRPPGNMVAPLTEVDTRLEVFPDFLHYSRGTYRHAMAVVVVDGAVSQIDKDDWTAAAMDNDHLKKLWGDMIRGLSSKIQSSLTHQRANLPAWQLLRVRDLSGDGLVIPRRRKRHSRALMRMPSRKPRVLRGCSGRTQPQLLLRCPRLLSSPTPFHPQPLKPYHLQQASKMPP
jgi:hypothetical protein